MEVLVAADETLLGEFRIAELMPLLPSVKHVLVECVPSHYQFYQSFGFKLREEEGEGPAAAHQLRTQAITLSLSLLEQNPRPKNKANLLISVTSREMAPDSLRKLAGQLKRD